MTLRNSLDDAGRDVHEQLDRLLDSEDAIIVLVDRERAMTFARGFSLSAAQLELLAVDVERLIRAAASGRRGLHRSNGREPAGNSHRRRDIVKVVA